MRTIWLGLIAAMMLSPAMAQTRDGSHDFDFEFGTWKSHTQRLLHPLSGKQEWATYDGIAKVRKVWNGTANLVDLSITGPAGHIDGLSLRLYMPKTDQWRLYYANGTGGTVSLPAVGSFKDGRGVFYDQEDYNGRTVMVRQVWSRITATSWHFEQAFSADWGKTWEPNFVTTDTRISDSVDD